MNRKKAPVLMDLVTPFEEEKEAGWNRYPRPQLKRDSYIPLNGLWELGFQERNSRVEMKLGEILVPFPPESRIAGVRPFGSQEFGPIETLSDPHGRTITKNERWIYRRTMTIPEKAESDRVLLHFGAVDQEAYVYVNDVLVGSHIGGYLLFTLDITVALKETDNDLRVEVVDRMDTDLPYGKQRKDRGGMWYTPFSGIWQSVWLEIVPESYIENIKITPALQDITIEIQGGEEEKTVRVFAPRLDNHEMRQKKENSDNTDSDEIEGAAKLKHDDKSQAGNDFLDIESTEVPIQTIFFQGNSVTIPIADPRLWTPEEPYLYPVEITSGQDDVRSYFALRTFETREGKFQLNGKPIFLHGLLDQGYYSDGISLPGSPEGYTYDIRTMKRLGFNLLRKHIKIEPEQFYYDCDRLGMLVLQDLVSSGPYRYIRDTVLPTIGIYTRREEAPSEKRRAQFRQDALETLALLYNHPSVIGYTIFNEGWGQHDSDALYDLLKAEDSTRFYDATSGWFQKTKSDVVSRHVYFGRLSMKRFGPGAAKTPDKMDRAVVASSSRSAGRACAAGNNDRPYFLSEFGGYSYKVPGHAMNRKDEYGYRKFRDQESLTAGLKALYLETIVPMIREGLSGAVLTQVSDVEDETNGLVTYDRQVVKANQTVMREIAEALYRAAEES